MRTLHGCVMLLASGLAGAASAQVSVGDLQFLDRATRGEIPLGDARGSIGVIDFDNDGFFDLFFADSAGRANRLYRNVPSLAAPGGRAFANITAGTGLDDPDGTARSFGAVVILDFDNDGLSDIYTLGQGNNGTCGLLYRNLGNGTFANVSIPSGIRLSIPGFVADSASAVDFDLDGFTDLLVCPIIAPGVGPVLFRNQGNGTFASRADLLPPMPRSGRVYAHAWSDYDHDGFPDALICLDAGTPLTLKNVPHPSGGRRFIDATAESGFTRVGRAPMGIAPGDMDNDGDIDLAITDAVIGTYYENRQGTFVEITPFRTFFGWGTTWLDADNDGDLDNYQAGSYSRAAVDHLFRNDGGAWTPAQAALNTTALASQHTARIDFDNDGRDDLVTVNPGRSVSLYHNQSASGHHWSKVRLVGSGDTARDAAGAIVRQRAGGQTHTRELALGTSFGASEDPRASFGLAAATSIDSISIIWPRQGTLAQRTDEYPGPFPANTIITLSPRPPAPPCPADFNRDGSLDPDDLSDYIACYFGAESCAAADYNADGQADPDDLSDYIGDFFAACG